MTLPLAGVTGVVGTAAATAGALADADLERLWAERATASERMLEVRDGRPANGGFVLLDALLEEARVVRDGAPWSGLLSVAPDGTLGTAGPSAGEDAGALAVAGRGLLTGAPLTARGFSKALPGGQGDLIVTFAVLLFALSTAISWSYYGDRALEYLAGPRLVPIYRWIYVGFFFLGAILPLQAVWTFGDVALGLMSFPNLLALVLLSGATVKLTRDYYSREHKPYK